MMRAKAGAYPRMESIRGASPEMTGGMTYRSTDIRHLCRKTTVLSCYRSLIKTGAEKMNNM